MPRTRIPGLLLAIALGTACEREAREFRGEPPVASRITGQTTRLEPGRPGEVRVRPPVANVAVRTTGPYDENAYGIAEGQRLYSWFNCVGCHSHGGGGMGPPLMDEAWIYGGSSPEIFASILQGRENGMPSFRDRLTDQQAWQLVAYVRSMSARVPLDARPGRPDAMHVMQPATLREPPPDGEIER